MTPSFLAWEKHLLKLAKVVTGREGGGGGRTDWPGRTPRNIQFSGKQEQHTVDTKVIRRGQDHPQEEKEKRAENSLGENRCLGNRWNNRGGKGPEEARGRTRIKRCFQNQRTRVTRNSDHINKNIMGSNKLGVKKNVSSGSISQATGNPDITCFLGAKEVLRTEK